MSVAMFGQQPHFLLAYSPEERLTGQYRQIDTNVYPFANTMMSSMFYDTGAMLGDPRGIHYPSFNPSSFLNPSSFGPTPQFTNMYYTPQNVLSPVGTGAYPMGQLNIPQQPMQGTLPGMYPQQANPYQPVMMAPQTGMYPPQAGMFPPQQQPGMFPPQQQPGLNIINNYYYGSPTAAPQPQPPAQQQPNFMQGAMQWVMDAFQF